MEHILEKEKLWINETRRKIEKKMSFVIERSKNKIPYTAVNGVYDDCSSWEGKRSPDYWTNGFWPGILWILYQVTGKEIYKSEAEIAEEKLDSVLMKPDLLSHDMGFMWHLSAGANYQITKNEKSRERMLMAASYLASRYNCEGKFIRAWNGKGKEGWAIIDCMMNLPLLYWASEETGDPRFSMIAINHADKTLQNHIRADGSVYHILEYDVNNGEVISKPWTQGYDAEKSSWSRGQSWALYGFVLSYMYTKQQRYMDAAKRVAHYFISAICNEEYIPKCDFRAPEEPDYIDTTAGAIAACGLIEIANSVDVYEKKLYIKAAIKILKALEKNHCNWNEDEDSILQNGTQWYGNEVHMPIIYGDFFFIEAMYKLDCKVLKFW